MFQRFEILRLKINFILTKTIFSSPTDCFNFAGVMKSRVFLYLSFLFIGLLSVCGWSCHPYLQQYEGKSNQSSEYRFFSGASSQNTSSDEYLGENYAIDQYRVYLPPSHETAGNLSEFEWEENVENTGSPQILMFMEGEFWRFFNGFSDLFHTRKTSVSLFTYREHLKLSYDALYIQYRVIRL